MMAMGKKIATRESYGNTLVELAKEHDDLVVLDADLAGATKTSIFQKAYPDRFIDCGIAEGNMMVKESVEFRESARVKGNVSSECISMYNGAHVKGMIDIGGIEEIKEE